MISYEDIILSMTTFTRARMKTHRLISTLFLQAIFLYLSFFQVAHAEEKIVGDRLIVELNGIKYTQREVESYYLVKVILSLGNDETFTEITAKNWEQIVTMFHDEMILDQEAIRLGSFRPVGRIMDRANTVFASRIKSHMSAENMSKRLGLEGSSLTDTLNVVLRVQAFRQNKQRQMQAEDNQADMINDQPDWFRELASRAVSRRFKQANRYVLIQPTFGMRASNVQ